MVISHIIALVYDPVKLSHSVLLASECLFDDFQLSKTVFILARFCSIKLFILANKGCSTLVPRSDLDLDGSALEPAIRSGDTGRWIPCLDSCQLITTLMYNMCAISVFLCYQDSWKVWDWTLVALWCGRTSRLRAVYGHVITKFSGMGRFTYP